MNRNPLDWKDILAGLEADLDQLEVVATDPGRMSGAVDRMPFVPPATPPPLPPALRERAAGLHARMVDLEQRLEVRMAETARALATLSGPATPRFVDAGA